jgi:hypothetical protein
MRDDTLDIYARVHHRVDEILHYIWDPIGIGGVAMARDEYDGYVPTVVKMLFGGESKEAIARYLHEVAGGRMGLTVGSRPSDHVEEVAELLLDHYEALRKKA